MFLTQSIRFYAEVLLKIRTTTKLEYCSVSHRRDKFIQTRARTRFIWRLSSICQHATGNCYSVQNHTIPQTQSIKMYSTTCLIWLWNVVSLTASFWKPSVKKISISEGPSLECNIHSITYLLTPWCRVLLEKLTGLQLVKKFPAFHGTPRFITALTSVRHLSLSWASPIQSIHPHPTSWRSILILSTHLCLGLPSGLFPSGFPTKTLYTPLSSPIRAICPAHLIEDVHSSARNMLSL